VEPSGNLRGSATFIENRLRDLVRMYGCRGNSVNGGGKVGLEGGAALNVDQ
jgi:hypothetical protein